MRAHHRNGTTVVALSALVLGVTACSGSGENRAPAWDDQDFANAEFAVGEAVTGCSTGTSGFNSTNNVGVLTIQNFTGTVVLSAPGGVLKMNGQTCTTGDNGTGTALKVTGTGSNVVKRIVMDDQATDDKVLLDMYAGPFTTVFAGTAGTGLDITFSSGSDAFLVRGSNAVDKVSVIQANAADALYFDIGTTTDGKADVKVADSDVTGVAVKVSMASGADVFAAVSSGITSYNGANISDLVMPAGAMTVYGGDGTDLITDGNGADILYGGAGNDTIKASNVGNDTIYGGADTDLIDYSARSSSAAVDLTLANQGTFTLTDQPADTETVTVGTRTYTFQNTLTNVDGNVKIGATAAESLANLIAAINSGTGAGTKYATATQPNTEVSAARGASSLQMVVTAKTSGPTADAYASTTTVTNGSWGATTLGSTSASVGTETDLLWEFENAYGGAGADTIRGDEAGNVLYGSGGADVIYGGGAADTIYGGDGNDAVYGGAGSSVDVLYGEAGDDTFYADYDPEGTGDGADSVVGANGTDTMSYAARSAAVTVTLAATTSEEILANDIEQVIGGEAGDIITCGALSCTVWGGNGADSITGGSAADYLSGDAGNDTIKGAGGGDVLLGEDDDDSVDGEDGDDTVSGGAGADTLAGSNGADQVFGGAGTDSMTGGSGIDMLSGGAGVDTVDGGSDAGDLCVDEGGDSIAANTCDVM